MKKVKQFAKAKEQENKYVKQKKTEEPFLLDFEKGIIHHKDCFVMDKNRTYTGLSRLSKRHTLCPKCKRLMLMTQLIQSTNPSCLNNFKFFIEEHGIKNSWLENIYKSQDNVRMHIVSPDVLRVLAQNDVWEIEFDEDLVHLYHGNYAISNRNTKLARRGMHEENLRTTDRKESLRRAFLKIEEHDFKKRLEIVKEERRAAAVRM